MCVKAWLIHGVLSHSLLATIKSYPRHQIAYIKHIPSSRNPSCQTFCNKAALSVAFRYISPHGVVYNRSDWGYIRPAICRLTSVSEISDSPVSKCHLSNRWYGNVGSG
jgi:hypothetical protein